MLLRQIHKRIMSFSAPDAPELIPAFELVLTIDGSFPADLDMNRLEYAYCINIVSAVSHLLPVNGSN